MSSNANSLPSSVDITKEEFESISRALKKEEFRKLLLEYCEEIQDPENRKKYQDEIRQLEAERGVEVKFVNPLPGFVLKTSDCHQKTFINIAKCATIGKPTSELYINSKTNARGYNWSIPLAQSEPRDDIDGSGKRCRVYDVVFHPDALHLAQNDSVFRNCLIDTALDAVEREFQIKLDRTNLRFPKLPYKGIPRATIIRKLATNAPKETLEPHPLESLYPKRPDASIPQTKVLPLKDVAACEKPEFTIPRYILTYRRDVDLSEYTNELDAKLNVTRPTELIAEIELPLLKTASECQLDVTTRGLYLRNERAGAKYRLVINLPHFVDDKRSNARFFAETRRMCVTMPVVQQTVAQQREMRNELLQISHESESDTADEIQTDSNNEDDEKDNADKLVNLDDDYEMPKPFLNSRKHYVFPKENACEIQEDVVTFSFQICNVVPSSMSAEYGGKFVHLQFASIGDGFYPTYYAFYLELPATTNISLSLGDFEAKEEYVFCQIHLDSCNGEQFEGYLAGIDRNDLEEYVVKKITSCKDTAGSTTEANVGGDSVVAELIQCEPQISLDTAENTLDDHAVAEATEQPMEMQLDNAYLESSSPSLKEFSDERVAD